MRSRARFMLLATAGLTLIAPATAALGAPTSPAGPHYHLTITGIDRNGAPVSVQASVYGATNGVEYLSGGSSVSLAPGYYEVAAPIWQSSDGASQSLAAARVHLTHNQTVTLSAVGAVPVTEGFAPPGATLGGQTESLCISGGGTVNTITGLLVEPSGTVYVKPTATKGVQTVYQAYWQGTGTIYDIGHSYTGGIPANPVYHDTLGGLAKVGMLVAANENSSPLQTVIAGYAGCGSIDLPEDLVPDVYTDYRSPGTWNINADFSSSAGTTRDLYTQAAYKAGHTYSDDFGLAAAGPGPQFPVIDGRHVTYSPAEMFSDTAATLGFDCEGKATVTLTRGKTVVHSQKLTFCGKSSTFGALVKKSGWYTLTANAVRWNYGHLLPSGELSSNVALSWRFYFTPSASGEAAPVTTTRFQPEGLGWYNDGTSGTTTTVRVMVFRGGAGHRLRTIRVQFSANGGAWHTVAAVKHGSYWLVKIPNPADNAYISLRSVVTDSVGDATTETITRGYEVQVPD